VNPTDPVLQILNNGNNPSGTLTTTNILIAAQTYISAPETDAGGKLGRIACQRVCT
jgi:hypothetical protein